MENKANSNKFIQKYGSFFHYFKELVVNEDEGVNESSLRNFTDRQTSQKMYNHFPYTEELLNQFFKKTLYHESIDLIDYGEFKLKSNL